MNSLICNVPSEDLYAAYQKQRIPLLVESEERSKGVKEFEDEAETYAIPALKQKYDELVKVWENLSKWERMFTRKPVLEIRSKTTGSINVYQKQTFSGWLYHLTHDASEKHLWFLKDRLTIFDVHEFGHPYTTIRYALIRQIEDLTNLLEEYNPTKNGTWTVEITSQDVSKLGLDPKKYERIQKLQS
jgi:hypothetical protein